MWFAKKGLEGSRLVFNDAKVSSWRGTEYNRNGGWLTENEMYEEMPRTPVIGRLKGDNIFRHER